MHNASHVHVDLRTRTRTLHAYIDLIQYLIIKRRISDNDHIYCGYSIYIIYIYDLVIIYYSTLYMHNNIKIAACI